MPSIIYIELRDNPGYHYADVLSAINYNFQLVSGGTGGGSGTTNVQPGTNITTGGTALAPIVSTVASPSFTNLTFSGTGNFAVTTSTTFSGGTVSGGTLYSGATNLSTTIINIANAAATSTGDFTRVRPGSNITTGNTANNPSVSVVSSPSFDGLTLSGTADVPYVSRTSASQLVFREKNTLAVHGDITYSTTDTEGIFRWVGQSRFSNLSATTLSAGTIYSGSTNLYNIFGGNIIIPQDYVAFGNSSSAITYSTGLTYNVASTTGNTTSGFRISSQTGGTKFEVYQPNRDAGFNSAFSITTSDSGTSGGVTATTNSRINASRLNIYSNGSGVFITNGIDAANGIGTNSGDLVLQIATSILRPAGASLQLGTANRTIGNVFIGNNTTMTQGAGSTGAYTLQLGGTRDDGAANKTAYLIKGASAYTTTHYLSVTDNQNNTMFTIGPDGKTGIGLSGAGTNVVTPTAFLDVRSVSGNTASIRIRSGATEPSSTNVGDIWNYSNHLRLNFSGLSMNRLFMFTGDTGIMTVKSTSGYGTIWLSDQAAALYASNTATFLDSQVNTYIRAGGTTIMQMQPTYLNVYQNSFFGGTVGAVTSRIEIQSATTSVSQLRLRSGSTVSSPVNGDIWSDSNYTVVLYNQGLRANRVTATTISATTATISKEGTGVLTVIGSGSSQPIFTVQGSQGELFSVTDSLSGSLFSVNDISGLPVLEAFSDSTILMGDYSAPALYTTTKTSLSSGTNSIYTIPTSAYTGAFVDYTVLQSGGARAGSLMMVWSGVTANFTETVTNDIGTTTQVSMSANVVGSYAVLLCSASTTGFVLKTIIRGI